MNDESIKSIKAEVVAGIAELRKGTPAQAAAADRVEGLMRRLDGVVIDRARLLRQLGFEIPEEE